MHEHTLLALGGIAAAGFACNFLAWRLRLPSIFFLVLAGILAGPVLGWLNPDELFGDLLVPFVSLAVAIVLFEGSLTLKLRDIRGHGDVVRRLVTAGILVTWVVGATTAHFVLGWDLALAALFGAIVSVSGPTVVMPLLRTVRLKEPLASVLRWEGILIDALGAILAVLVFNYIASAQLATGLREVAQSMGLIIAAGAGLGALAGYLLGLTIRRAWVPDFLRDFIALATVLMVFVAAESVAHESGLLAVTIMGVWLANMRGVDLDDILNFKESLTLILVAGLFIVLAARLNLGQLAALGTGVLAVLAILQFVGGPLRAWVCSLGSTLDWRERLFLGWMFPRGIVAAAVSALFALRLEDGGYPNADDLVPLVFGVILGTVIIQSISAGPIARWLGVSDPEPQGILVVGGNPVGIALASALQEAGHQVLLADDQWDHIREARMAGLPVFFGSAVSGYAEERLDLSGIGLLLAVSRRPSLNELACVRYANEFGRACVFTLENDLETGNSKYRIAGAVRGTVLLKGEHTVDTLQELLDDGATIRTTDITEEFSADDYRAAQPEAIVLFVTRPNGHVQFRSVETDEPIAPGSSITALLPTADVHDADAPRPDRGLPI